MRNTPCECPTAGWCQRHNCLKPEPMFQLCRRDQAMFRAWEDGQIQHLPRPEDIPGATPSLEPPSLMQRVANFGDAITRHAMSGFKRVGIAERETRLQICKQCPSCDIEGMVCRERGCGCYLETKANWASEDCPRGQWPPFAETQAISLMNDTSSDFIGTTATR